MTTEGMEQYMDTFKHGMPPHGGLGIGLERLTMKLIGEDNVRETTLFPRDMSRSRAIAGKKAERIRKMANIISDETIEYVGILAKLELNEEEKEQAKKDMGAMLDYIDKLNELDTTGVEPMSHVFPVTNVFREDVVTNGDGSEATLSNAPSMKDSGFKVPKTIG